MKIKRLTALVCAFALAAGASGVPAVKDVFGIDAAISASADSDSTPIVFDMPDLQTKENDTVKLDLSSVIPDITAGQAAAAKVTIYDTSVVGYKVDGTKINFNGIKAGSTKVEINIPSSEYILSSFKITVTAGSGVLLGDIDGSGEIDVDDLIILQKIVAGWKVDEKYKKVADLDEDGDTDVDDLILLQKKVAGWNVTFGK